METNTRLVKSRHFLIKTESVQPISIELKDRTDITPTCSSLRPVPCPRNGSNMPDVNKEYRKHSGCLSEVEKTSQEVSKSKKLRAELRKLLISINSKRKSERSQRATDSKCSD